MRNLLLALCLLCNPLMYAQTTLLYSDLVPSGVQLNMYVFSSGQPTAPPSDGTGQTWDLSNATFQQIGTMHFRPAAGTPFANLYANANHVFEQNVTVVGTQYMYLAIGPAGMEVVATDVPVNTNTYTNAKRVLAFPMAYGNTFSDDYVDNDGPANVSWSYTGEGTLLSSLGTMPGIAKVVSTEGDLVFWNKTPLYPVVLAASSSTPLVFADAATSIQDINQGRAVLAYPNPCTNALHVEGRPGATWRITDIQGRSLQSGNFTTLGTTVIDVSQLASGVHLFLSDADQGTRSVRFHKL